MESRRTFLKVGLLAAVFETVPLKKVFSQSFKARDGNPGETPLAQTDPLVNYSKATFVSYLNSIFQIQSTLGIVEVTLAKVNDMQAAKDGECFSLLFRGGRAALKQNTYVMVHPALGTFQLFLVPSGSDQNGAQEFSATINRLSLADFTRVVAPSRTTAGAQRNNSQASSSTTNTNSTSPSTSTSTSTSTQVTSKSNQTNNSDPALPVVASPTRQRRRKPSRKRLDSKSPFIN